MRSRQRVSVVWKSALLLGITLSALPGPTVVQAADVRGNKKSQGKEGDLCTSTTDCEQKPTVLTCQPMGKQKQCAEPPRAMIYPKT